MGFEIASVIETPEIIVTFLTTEKKLNKVVNDRASDLQILYLLEVLLDLLVPQRAVCDRTNLEKYKNDKNERFPNSHTIFDNFYNEGGFQQLFNFFMNFSDW